MNMKAFWLAGVVALCLAFASMARADSTALDRFGIGDHLELYSDQSIACDEIIASGIKYVRIGPGWQDIELSKGVYSTTMLTRVDDIVNRLSAQNVKIVFVLCYTPLWASSQPSTIFAKPTNWADWESYVQFITARYNNKVMYWEVWNEPDMTGFWNNSVQDYVTLLQKAAVKIRAANVNNKVLMGGLATSNGGVDSYGLGTFFDTMLGLGAATSFDIVNYHSYGTCQRWRNVYYGMKAVIDKYSLQSRKIWVTETGYSTGGNATLERIKSNYVEQIFYTYFDLNPNLERVFYYVHRNPTVPGNPVEENYGLCAQNRAPLTAFYRYQSLNGASTDFRLQTSYPTLNARRVLNYVSTTTGDGRFVTNDLPDGSTKRIQVNTYMYATIDDNWINDNPTVSGPVYVDITYLDTGTAIWGIQYDGLSNAYQTLTAAAKTNTGTWLTKTFTLPDAKFANRQNYAADLRIYTPYEDLVVKTITVRRDATKAWTTLGATDPNFQLWRFHSDNTGDEAYNPVATMGAKSCRQITSNSKYIYFNVSDTLFWSGDTHAAVTMSIWDAGTDYIAFQYNSTSNNYQTLFVQKTNTNTWRTVTLNLTDANFTNQQNNGCDLRIGNAGDGTVEYISSVTVQPN